MNYKSKYDVGKRSIYNYHVNNTMNNRKIIPEIVDCWYPTTPHQEEVFILNKLKGLCNGCDGVPINIKEGALPLLFMTAGFRRTNDGMYIQENDVIRRRTCSRFDDFQKRGLIDGRIGAPVLTFSGLLRLNELVTIDDSTQVLLQELIDTVIENENHFSQVMQLVESLQEQKKTKKSHISDVITGIANVATIASAAPMIKDIQPTVTELFHNLFQSLGF